MQHWKYDILIRSMCVKVLAVRYYCNGRKFSEMLRLVVHFQLVVGATTMICKEPTWLFCSADIVSVGGVLSPAPSWEGVPHIFSKKGIYRSEKRAK